MNKKFKIVSTVAVAGIMTFSAFCAQSFAATSTRSEGINSKLISGTKVIPYVLSNEDGRDTATVEELKAEFPGAEVDGKASGNVATGDVVKYNGENHTVVVYGDINQDGRITAADVVALSDAIVKKTVNSFSPAVKEAANVESHNGAFTVADVLKIQDWSVGKKDVKTVVEKVKLPDADPTEVVEAEYNVTINKNNVINNQDNFETAPGSGKYVLPIRIDILKELDKNTSVYLYFVDSNDKEVAAGKAITLNTSAKYLETDFSITAAVNTSLTGKAATDLADGEIRVELRDGTKAGAKVLYSGKMVKDTGATPVARNIVIRRPQTRNAYVSLESGYNGDIVKVKYTVYKMDGTTPVAEGTIEGANIEDNKYVNNYQIAKDCLDTGTNYLFGYVLENSYGSKSVEDKTTIVPVNGSTKYENPVITLDKTTPNTFVWDAQKDATGAVVPATYSITAYKDDEVIDTTTVASTAATTTPLSYNMGAKMSGVGKYRIEVYAVADNNHEASECTISDDIEVSKINPVTGVKFFEKDDTTINLTWTNSNTEEALKNATYTINVYSVAADGAKKIVAPTGSANTAAALPMTTKEFNFTATGLIKADTVYIADVTVVADPAQKIYLDSNAADSDNEYFTMSAPKLNKSSITESSVTLTGIKEVNVPGKTTTYKVKVDEVRMEDDGHGKETAKYVNVKTEDVTIEKGETTITGLESNKEYSFKLIAKIGNNETESAYTAAIRTLPVITKVTRVAKLEDVTDSNKVYVDATTNKVYIFGNKKALDVVKDYGNNPDLLGKEFVIKTLEVGDTVTFGDNEITLEYNGGERNILLTDAYLADKVVNVKTNASMKTITSATAVEELNLVTGTYDISGVTAAKKITVANDVDVQSTTALNYTVKAKALINGVYVSAAEETVMNISGAAVTVPVSGRITNELTFDNPFGKALTVKFTSDNGSGTVDSIESGKVTITSKTGVKVSTDNIVGIKANVNVTVDSGNVDVSDVKLLGTNTVTVKKGATSVVTVTDGREIPTELAGKTITVDNFDTVEKIVKDKTLTTDSERATAIISYVESLGLYGKGATLGVAGQTLTITFTTVGSDAQVSNK